MGLKRQHQIRMQQRLKRKKARAQLKKKGEEDSLYYYGKYYIKQS